MLIRFQKSFLLIALIVLLVSCSSPQSQPKTFVIEVAGSAMEPNYHDGQQVEIEEVKPADLKRGDVIVFTVQDRQYIKRLIGLPGETIAIRNGAVLINDKQIDEPYSPSKARSNSVPVTLTEDQYFVLGDNRNNSSDSRGFGAVLGSNIRGRAIR